MLLFISCAEERKDRYPQILDMVQSQYPMFVSTAPTGNRALLKSRGKTFDLFISDTGMVEPKRVDSSDFTQLSLTWHPHGKKIAFQEYNPKSNLFDLYLLDIDQKERALIGLPASNNAIPPIRWSPSGKYLAHLVSKGKEATLYVYDFVENNIKWTFNGLNSRSDFRWHRDSLLFFTEDPEKSILKAADMGTGKINHHKLGNIEAIQKISIKEQRALVVGRGKGEEYFQCFEMDLKEGRSRKLTDGNFNVTDGTYSKNSSRYHYTKNEDGLDKLYCSDKKVNALLQDLTKKRSGLTLDLETEKYLYLIDQNLDRPSRSIRLNLETGQKKVLYEPSYKAGTIPSIPEFLDIESSISKSRIKAFFWPSGEGPGISKKTILYVHGGPFLQSTPLWNVRTRILNEHGFNLMAVNYHGSSGYSNKFALQKDVPHQLSDIVASVRFLKQEYDIEEKDIVLMGSSYGGKLVTRAMDHIDAIGGVVLVSGNIDTFPSDRLKEIRILGFYGKLDPLTPKARGMLDKLGLLRSKRARITLFENEGHLFHRSSTWAHIYNEIVRTYQ